jgi:hypothetical protein
MGTFPERNQDYLQTDNVDQTEVSFLISSQDQFLEEYPPQPILEHKHNTNFGDSEPVNGQGPADTSGESFSFLVCNPVEDLLVTSELDQESQAQSADMGSCSSSPMSLSEREVNRPRAFEPNSDPNQSLDWTSLAGVVNHGSNSQVHEGLVLATSRSISQGKPSVQQGPQFLSSKSGLYYRKPERAQEVPFWNSPFLESPI